MIRGQSRPDWIEGFKPGEKLLIQRLRKRPCQRLVKVMMAIDQPRQHNMAPCIKNRITDDRRGAGRSYKFNNR